MKLKGIFWVVALFVFALIGVGFAAEIKPPRPPVSLDQFELFQKAEVPCGILTIFGHEENQSSVWVAYFINRETNPNPQLLAKLTTTNAEVWLDLNMDGEFDEYLTDLNMLESKYPSPCDAVKK